jgi:hypothetical protein
MLACLIFVRPLNIAGMGCKQKSCGSGSERLLKVKYFFPVEDLTE